MRFCLSLALAAASFAAAPPARLAPAQAALLRQRAELIDEARAALRAGKRADAFRLQVRAHVALAAVHGHLHTGVADDMAGFATASEAQGEWADAVGQWDFVLDTRRALLGRGHHLAEETRWSLETCRRVAALPEGRRAAATLATRRDLEARALAAAGRPHEALAEARKALRGWGDNVTRRDPFIAACHQRIGLALSALADHRAALAAYREALAVFRVTLGARHPAYAECLHNAGVSLLHLGEHEAALSAGRDAVAVYRAIGEEGRLTHALHSLALMLLEAGDHRAALPLLERVAALWGEGHPSRPTALSSLGGLHRDMGDARAALPLFREAIRLREAAGVKGPGLATDFNNLALAHVEAGDLDAALPLARRADEAARALGPASLRVTVRMNLATLLGKRGELAEAVPLAESAVAAARAGERRNPVLASSLHVLGVLLGRTDDHERGRDALHESLLAVRESLGPGHARYAWTLNNLARAYGGLHRPAAAALLSGQALAVAAARLDHAAAVQSDRQLIEAGRPYRVMMETYLWLPGVPGPDGHAHVLRWKGAAFAAQQRRRLFLRLADDPALRGLGEDLRDASRRLAVLSSRPDPRSRDEAEVLTRRKEGVERELATRSEAFRAAATPPSGEEIRRLLPPGWVLADFLVHEALGRPWVSAWVLSRGRPAARIDLGPAAPLEATAAAWRAALEAGGDGAGHAARLRSALWRPLRAHLAGAAGVLLSPDGFLARLPFAALPGDAPGKFLIEETALAVIPAPRLLPALFAPPPKADRPALLAVGGVDFDAPSPGKPLAPAAWPALPGTAREAAAVAAGYRAGPVVSLSGAKASAAALREALGKARLAHLATHGYFAPPARKNALDGRAGFFDGEGVTGWNPGLLSGLVLAGANRPTDRGDGVLTALEVADLDLSGMELAVLSACQTGLGKEAAGEGMLGLQRAFAVAGCRSVVSSLWSVHDAATSVLMERFYLHLWDKKLPKIESLRQAQLDVLRHPEWVEGRVKTMRGTLGLRGVGKAGERIIAGKTERRSPPAWWAAWQLSGDWR